MQMQNLRNRWLSENMQIIYKVLLIFFISRLFMLVLMLIYNMVNGHWASVADLMNQWDAKRYVYITNNGYTFPMDSDPQANWAFFPAYPILVWVVKTLLFGLDANYAGILVSSICACVASVYGVKYMRMLNKGNGYLMAVLLLCAPYTFYMASVYTESLFLMSIVMFFYYARKKNYLIAGMCAALASFTRVVGCILVFALIIEMYLNDYDTKLKLENMKRFVIDILKTPKKILSILLCPSGVFLYMAYLYNLCGDAWAFKNVQIAWRTDEYFPFFGVMKAALFGEIEPRYTYMGWFCVAAFIVFGYMLYKKYYSQAVFGFITLIIPLTSHVMSTCRFIAGSYVIFIGIYDLLSKKKKIRNIVLAVFFIAEAFLLWRWFGSDCWLM